MASNALGIMAVYTWEHGSTEAGLLFTVIFDSVAGTFTVKVLEGSMDLAALWLSDGDSAAEGNTKLSKSDNSLNMNGSTQVWGDGSSVAEKFTWDLYQKDTSSTGIITAGNSITITASQAMRDFLTANISTIVLGIRATRTSAEGGSIKWADASWENIVYGDDVQIGNAGPGSNRLVGDAELLEGRDRGGDDRITGGAGADKNLIYGDAYEMIGEAKGGDDVVVGGEDTEANVYTATPWLFGNFLYGDAYKMSGYTVGGNDTMIGGADSLWDYLRGDAFEMRGSAQGGNDILTGGAGTTYVRAYGDAAFMYDNAVGGDDILNGSQGILNGSGGTSRNLLMGDAFGMYGSTVAGNDTLVGGDNVNDGFYGYDQMFGDAVEFGYYNGGSPLGVAIQGGNDSLTAGSNSNTYMTGDAGSQESGVNYGGDDILVGGNGAGYFTFITGDVDYVNGGTLYGGNDRLISGSGSDYMYGDAYLVAGGTLIGGNDTFVFSALNNGDDYINDFEAGKDMLEFGDLAFGDLAINVVGTDSFISWAGGSVTVYNNTNLTSRDFIVA